MGGRGWAIIEGLVFTDNFLGSQGKKYQGKCSPIEMRWKAALESNVVNIFDLGQANI